MQRGSEPGTGISVAWRSATMFQPNSSAARAGKAASRSRVTVNKRAHDVVGLELVGLDQRAKQLVGGGQDLAASLRSTVVAPRMPCSRWGDGVMDR
jgi:hypothetical protein